MFIKDQSINQIQSS